jgi:sugar phosphate isomerase/epimerase
MSNRRHFLQWAAAGAAASVASGRGLAAEPVAEKNEKKRPAKARSKRAYELGLASYTFQRFPLDQALAMTKRLGLKHICLKGGTKRSGPQAFHLALDSTPEQIAQAVAKVKAAGLDLYGGGVIGMGKAAEVEQAFAYAKAAGMRIIVGIPSPDMLPLVNEKVQEYDIRVAIHNHGPDVKVFRSPGEIYEKIRDLDRRVGLCMDIGHTMRTGVDPSHAAEQVADRLLDIHMKDVSAASRAGKTVEIGRGIIDIPKFLRMLDKIHYGGYVSFEFEKDSTDPLPGLAESVGYVRGVLATIG